MRDKHKHNRLKIHVIVPLVAVAALAVASALLLTNHSKGADAATPPKSVATVPSDFSFDTTGAPNWTKGPSNKTSLALFYKLADCFVSVEYDQGTVDVATQLQKNEADITAGGYTATPSGDQAATLQTNAGRQQYQLHQYSVTGSGSMGSPYGGHEFGYLQLSKGYIKAQGWCDTSAHLSATVSALQAIKFN